MLLPKILYNFFVPNALFLNFLNYGDYSPRQSPMILGVSKTQTGWMSVVPITVNHDSRVVKEKRFNTWWNQKQINEVFVMSISMRSVFPPRSPAKSCIVFYFVGSVFHLLLKPISTYGCSIRGCANRGYTTEGLVPESKHTFAKRGSFWITVY